ncbi:MAG TPA: sigma-70 family RNA polymerase sigma factor [Gemmataceae bacterium]
MPDTRQHPILNYLRQVLGSPAGGGVSDADLLHRFVNERDEAAFELLMWRHAAMVLHVCAQVLSNRETAEDAFQATFLVFVRKAGSISRREALGSWLYRVAYRTALKARTRDKRRPSPGPELDLLEAPPDGDDAGQRELRRMICEEVNRLPAKYRAPIVACFFEGKTHEEAANQLGWPRGTVAGRLARARELLHRRLTRRGVTLSAAALISALTVRSTQAALTGLVEATIQITKGFAAGQPASALASPRVAALTEGVLQAMNGIRLKSVVAVLLLVCVGGAGATLWATQRREREQPVDPAPAAGAARAEDHRDAGGGDAQRPEDTAQLARNVARSRLNLKQLALAMHNYNDTYGRLPLAATTDKKGKALLSWRVALLPYLEEQELYKQFKLDEPWDSPHNKKLLSKMPAIYAPPGVKTRQLYSTFYQVFVSTSSSAGAGMVGMAGGMSGMSGGMAGMSGGPSGMSGGMAGMSGGPSGGGPPGGMAGGTAGKPGGAPGKGDGSMRPPGGMPPGMGGGSGAAGAPAHDFGPTAAFTKGAATRIPASFPDGTSNTILIIEAGNPVPWTKPEDLRYADDEPLPELGGLFSDVIHAAFADGAVHTLLRGYDEKHLRYAITSNDGMPFDMAKIQGRARRAGRTPGGGQASAENWQRKNDELRKEVEQTRERIRLLKEEREVERELAGEDPRTNQLKEEHARLQAELKKLRDEMESLKAEIRRMQQPERKKGP